MPGKGIQHGDDYEGDKDGWVHRLLQKAIEFGFDSFGGRGADDPPGRIPFDKAKESRDRLNVVNEAEVKAIVRVDLHHFDSSRAIGRQFLEQRIEDLARAAPGSPEFH